MYVRILVDVREILDLMAAMIASVRKSAQLRSHLNNGLRPSSVLSTKAANLIGRSSMCENDNGIMLLDVIRFLV